MAYQLFQLPKTTNISSNLTLLSGAKALFQLTGTTNNTPVYQDSALTTPHTNPVVADAAGVFPVIYLNPSITYRVTISTSTDVLLYVADPANDLILTQSAIGLIFYPISNAESFAGITPTNYFEPYGYIERYGTNTTPGTTDMSSALVAANAQALQAGGAPVSARSVCHIASSTTISGKFSAPPIQVFSATSAVTFGSDSVSAVFAEWFGCKGDGTYNNFTAGTDNLIPFNKAIASLPAAVTGGGAVRLGTTGTYRFSAAPTLRSDLTIIGTQSAIPFSRTPILQAAGSGIFLDVNFQRVHLIGFQVFGNNVPGTKGVRIADQHNAMDNVVISQFDGGAGTCGLELAPAVGKQTLYFRGRNIWINSCYNGCQVGDSSGTVNANTIVNLILSGNSRNGILIDRCNVLNIFGIDAEGNVTGGTGANINIVNGVNIDITGYSEITSETGTKKNIIFPTASANAHNIHLKVYADGNVGTNFTNEDVYTYYMTNPRQVTNNEPPRYTNLSVNALSAHDPGQNIVTPILQGKNGPACFGAVKDAAGSSWPMLSMRGSGSIANDATLDLTAHLKGARTSIEGMLIAHSGQDNCAAIFYLKNNTTVEYLDPANEFSVTAGNAGTTNIYWDVDHYELENKSGGARTYSFQLLMT